MKKNLGLFRNNEGSDVQLCTEHWRDVTGGDRLALEFVQFLDDREDGCDVCERFVRKEKIQETLIPR